MTDFLWNQPEQQPSLGTLLLAHGAGAAMDAPFMNKLVEALTSHGLSVARFEFSYMARRRKDGKKAPPPKAEKLVGEFQTALQSVLLAQKQAQIHTPVFIGGKSMGGRVSAMLAGGSSLPANVKAVLCFGYPFHPTGKADAPWRLEPLEQSKRPVHILQGERDPFGTQTELTACDLPASVSFSWLEDGNHDFGPRGSSPATLDGNIAEAARQAVQFLQALDA